MTDDTQQPKEYIITEDELNQAVVLMREFVKGNHWSEFNKQVRSRPSPAPCNYPDIISCPNAILCSECNVNDIASAAARQAREDVLEEIRQHAIKAGFVRYDDKGRICNYTYINPKRLLQKIESLRGDHK